MPPSNSSMPLVSTSVPFAGSRMIGPATRRLGAEEHPRQVHASSSRCRTGRRRRCRRCCGCRPDRRCSTRTSSGPPQRSDAPAPTSSRTATQDGWRRYMNASMRRTPARSAASIMRSASRGRQCQRLFAQDVLAGLGGGDRPCRVEVVRQRDVHGVDVRVGEERLVASRGRSGSEAPPQTRSARARSRDAMATTSQCSAALDARDDLGRAMAAVDRTPQRSRRSGAIANSLRGGSGRVVRSLHGRRDGRVSHAWADGLTPTVATGLSRRQRSGPAGWRGQRPADGRGLTVE